jgi:hypothetical protein
MCLFRGDVGMRVVHLGVSKKIRRFHSAAASRTTVDCKHGAASDLFEKQHYSVYSVRQVSPQRIKIILLLQITNYSAVDFFKVLTKT